MNLRIAGLLTLLAMAGCAPLEQAPPAKVMEAGAPKKPLAEAKAAPTPPPEVKSATAEPAAPPAASPPADTPAPRVVEPGASAAKAETPADKPAAKASAEPKKETSAAPAKPPAAPPLDLNALEKRLKDSEAIGVFTKLTLKNQVDDLVQQFEAHHEGASRSSLSELRQPYDLLILKVLSLLQNRDPPLAKDIYASREAIWSILVDPAKFRRVVNQNRS